MDRRRLATAGVSLAAHLAVLAMLMRAAPAPPEPREPAPIAVAIVDYVRPPPPAPKAEPSPEPEPAPAEPPPKLRVREQAPAPPEVAPLVAAVGEPTQSADGVSDMELASAAGAGKGGGSGCDMPAFLQDKLRGDPKVREAVAGEAVRVWNGDWVRRTGQEGAGLARVREAIMWEVAFAPAACRAEPVHGLVLIELADGGRIVLGAARWRWSDLLFSRSTRGGRAGG